MNERAHTGGAYRCDCLAKYGTDIMDPFVGVYAADYELHYRSEAGNRDCGILLVGKCRLNWTIINGV